MAKSTTATVETLTAEVRVLMIGSRQVTLSVYSQLDHVRYDEIEPFGRVSPRGAIWGRIYVVGRAQDGALVRSELFSSWRWISDNGPQVEYMMAQHGDDHLLQELDVDNTIDDPRMTAAEWEELPLIVLAGLR